ncbi:MAG: type II secretion system protein [Solirubrobacterales bacterium]
MQAKRGFTLVEILIVVVILGILAAIVIPQFTQASSEAKLNSLTSNLQSIRSQVELFKTQHDNEMIPAPAADGTWPLMTETSSRAGVASGTKVRDNTSVCGPYLERVPENPFNGLNTVTEVAAKAAADGASGWCIVTGTGEVYANNTGTIPGDDTVSFDDL